MLVKSSLKESSGEDLGKQLGRQTTKHDKMFAKTMMKNMVNSGMVKQSTALLRTSAVAKKGNMFAKQTELPHLPVPPLQQTLAKYLLAVRCLVDDADFNNTKKIVEEFGKPGSIGEILQEKLIERSRFEVNWVSKWWDNGAYFDFRMPVVVHSSPGIAFPKQTFTDELDQLRFAARLTRCVIHYKGLVDSESVPVDMLGPHPMCMMQYSYLLSNCRIPHPKRDIRVKAKSGEDQHIIVVHNNRFYSVDIYRDGHVIPETEILTQLIHIKKSSQANEFPVGILTSDGRTQWAHARQRLLKDSGNRSNLDKIEKSIFVLCLDDTPQIQPCNQISSCADPDYTVTAGQALHGGGSKCNSGNRWFDKIFQCIVNKDGYVSVCYEHSAAEGPPALAVCNHIMAHSGNYKETKPAQNMALVPPKQMEWKLNDENIADINSAIDNIDSLVNDVDLQSFIYKGYGKEMAKKFKLSPDAFIQVVFQLSYYRLHRSIPPTYESASVRMFQHGRTDTIRSASMTSKAFVEAMLSPGKSTAELVTLFKNAVLAHTKYTKEACTGEAIDRHLFGLKKVAVEAGIDLPEIFMDKTFSRTLHFNVSTSQIASKYGLTASFGPAVPDGYGICYNPHGNKVFYNVSTFNSNPETNTAKMGEEIGKCFDEIGMMLSKSNL